MGWDAYAKKNGRNIGKKELADFRNAEKRAARECGMGSIPLARGEIFGLECAEALEQATNKSTRGEDWDAAMVRSLNRDADWNRCWNDNPVAVAHAKYFLICCARNGLGIRFSW